MTTDGNERIYFIGSGGLSFYEGGYIHEYKNGEWLPVADAPNDGFDDDCPIGEL